VITVAAVQKKRASMLGEVLAEIPSPIRKRAKAKNSLVTKNGLVSLSCMGRGAPQRERIAVLSGIRPRAVDISPPLVANRAGSVPRFTPRETGNWADDNGRREMTMGLLWLLVLLLIIFAVLGGVAVNNWLWLLLIIVLVLVLVGYA
jgi:hypothetical protein